jgi:predicted DCC family thiol-disulfide oxidoreductase YuxK
MRYLGRDLDFRPRDWLGVDQRSLSRLKEWAGIDLRTLAFFRVFLAVAILADLYSYWPHLDAFFTDDGLYPRREAMSGSSLVWSLYYVSGHWLWALCLFIATALSALALLFGYRTRWATVLCWILVTSLSKRAGMLNSSADMQLNLLLFWAMFVPLGARFSVDSALTKEAQTENAYASVATLALMLQVAYVYVFGALLKVDPEWTETFHAIYYSLNAHHFITPLAPYFALWPEPLHWLTFYVYFLELLAIILLFSPMATAACRLAVLPLLVSLHVGFALLLSIGIFPLVSVTGLTVFVPGLFWNYLLPRFNARPSRRGIQIFYDKDCHFCRKTCVIFRALGLPPSASVEPAQNYPDVCAILERDNSWVVKDADGRYRTKWDAVAYVWRRSPLLWPLGFLFLPSFMRPLGERFYGVIARNRGALGRLSARLLPERDTASVTLMPALQVVLAAIMAGVFLWNLQNLPAANVGSHPDWLRDTFRVLRLDQRWSMFAGDNLPGRTIWVVLEGVRADGSRVDLLRGSETPPSFGTPQHGYQAFPDFRMRKFFTRVSLKEKRGRIGRYFCREWSDPGNPLREVKMYRFSKRTLAPGEAGDPPVRQTTYSYSCA